MIRYPYQGEPSWPHTTIGLHLKPAAHYTDVLGNPDRRAYELGILKRIRASWATMITDGDSAIEIIDGKEAVRWFLDEQIVPIIRDSTTPLPRHYANIGFVEKLVPIYADYGMRPTVILFNEPGDGREWKNGDIPPNWQDVFLGLWIEAARQVLDTGANVAFPDPLGDWGYFFERIPVDLIDAFRDGRCTFSAHLYVKARPLDYPMDDVSWYGTPLTMEQWRYELDYFWDVPGWREQTLEQINAQRAALANPNKTFLDDSTCFGAWRNIYYAAEQAWGFRPVMSMNEGGCTPKDQAGSGPDNDYRYPPSTFNAIARKTLGMLSVGHDMYALTPWIIYGWSDDGWIYNGLCKAIMDSYEQPVIAALEQREETIVSLTSGAYNSAVSANDDLEAALRMLR